MPCLHRKGKKDVADKDKGNRGNFYTVTPKMNGVGVNGSTSVGGASAVATSTTTATDDPPEVVEAQQFFEHMISLQKNQGTLGQARRKTSANGSQQQSGQEQQQETTLNEDPKNVASSEPGYPRRAFARALSPYNHIYMEIDPTDGPEGGGGAVYEPLTHSETYMMSTVSDMSEDNNGFYGVGGGVVNYSDLSSRQSSSRESRPLIAR